MSDAIRDWLWADLPKRDRVVYGFLAALLIFGVFIPYFAILIARAVADPIPIPIRTPIPTPTPSPIPIPVPTASPSPIPIPHPSWLATHDEEIVTLAQALFALDIFLLVAWEFGKRTFASLFAPRISEPQYEVPGALLLAIVPGAFLSGIALFVAGALGLLFRPPGASRTDDLLLVPLPFAIAGTCYAVSFAVIFSIRLTRPPKEP